jgi:hypothetical protein
MFILDGKFLFEETVYQLSFSYTMQSETRVTQVDDSGI